MFVNLYTETEYSLLHSPNNIDELVRLAKEYGYDALAITDLNNMFGAIKFYNKCLEFGLKPIIGLHFKKDDIDLLFYAKSNRGYINLMKLATLSILKSQEKVTLPSLKEYSRDIIAIIPSEESSIYNEYLVNIEGFINKISEIKEIFSDLYFGINFHTYLTKENNLGIVSLLKERGIKTCEISKCSYFNNDYFDSFVCLNSVALGGAEYPYTEMDMNLKLLTKVEKEALFNDYKEALINSSEIAQSCNIEIKFDGFKTPSFVSTITNKKEYLYDLAKLGLNKRLSQKDHSVDVNLYKERLLYELDVISKMNFVEYFLIVYDYVKYAKTNKILVGPGRGSGGGSLVSYSLGITEVDPIEYDLMFERFLNPERTSMPDIDVDFPDDRRDEVIHYMGSRYGNDKVAHICTFDTYGAKSAIRDVARVLKLDDSALNEILKQVSVRKSFKDALSSSLTLRQMAEEYENIQRLCDVVKKIEGLPRHTSVHASGIVMADKALSEYVPLMEGMNGLYETQYEAGDLEFLGLVKFDFLGIRNLTTIHNVITEINKTKEFSIKDINYNDPNVFKLIANGDTDGIFQLESDGMRQTLMHLKTSSFEDIIASISLYRPGPMDMIPSYINRKLGKEKVTYPHSSLVDVLRSTYGIIVYQEQVIKVSQVFAGYTLGEADVLRRAVSKKKEALILEERKNFIARSLKNGRTESDAQKIYDYIVKFANYGFNRSHAVVYSVVAYQMAYLKTYFYKEFMSEMMTNSLGKNQSLKYYINGCERRNIKVFLPNINKSTDRFRIMEDGIYYSLLGIKEVGKVSYDNFIEERNKNGEYLDFDDFVRRTKSIFSKGTVINLINAGALDVFNIPRKQMTLEYDNSLTISEYGQMILDKLAKREFSDEEYSFEEISKNEKDALGFNLKYDLFKRYAPLKKQYNVTDIGLIKGGNAYNLLFTLTRIKEVTTKTNKKMAFLELSDESGEVDGVLFSEKYDEFSSILKYGKVYLAKGKAEVRNERMQVVIEALKCLSNMN